MATIPAVGHISDAARTEGETKQDLEDLIAGVRQIPGSAQLEGAKTIAGGSITPDGGLGVLALDTEAAAATDDLANIITTNHPDGAMLLLRNTNASHVIVVKDSAGGAGQIHLDRSASYTLNDTKKWLLLVRRGADWYEVLRGPNRPMMPVMAKSATYTVVKEDVGSVINCTGTFSVNLLAVAEAGNGFTVGIRNVGSGTITIDPFSAELIDSAATLVLAPGFGTLVDCTGTEWTSVVPVRQSNVFAAYSANATISVLAEYASLSGASFTLTLNSAVGNAGKEITIIHQGTSLTQVYTIAGAGGTENIDGTTTYLLYTNGESVTIFSDGANWLVRAHYAETDWVDAGAQTITGTTTNPTKPTTPDIDKVYWRRSGNRMFLLYILQISSAAGGAAGSGSYLWALPTNLSFDTTIMTPVATTMTTGVRSEASSSFLQGSGHICIDSASQGFVRFFAYDTTHFQVQNVNIADAGTVGNGNIGSTDHTFTNAEQAFNFELNARCAGWRK